VIHKESILVYEISIPDVLHHIRVNYENGGVVVVHPASWCTCISTSFIVYSNIIKAKVLKNIANYNVSWQWTIFCGLPCLRNWLVSVSS